MGENKTEIDLENIKEDDNLFSKASSFKNFLESNRVFKTLICFVEMHWGNARNQTCKEENLNFVC